MNLFITGRNATGICSDLRSGLKPLKIDFCSCSGKVPQKRENGCDLRYMYLVCNDIWTKRDIWTEGNGNLVSYKAKATLQKQKQKTIQEREQKVSRTKKKMLNEV